VTAPDAVGCGVFLVSPGDLGALGDAAEQLAALAEGTGAGGETGETGRPRPAAAFSDPVAMLLVGLVRGGVMVTAAGVDPLRCGRVATMEQVLAAAGQLHAASPDTVRMNAAVKAADGFVATFLVSPYSRYVARWAARREVTPHAVTGASAGLALLAAVWFSDGTRAGLIAGAVFVFAAFVLDCTDGQVARYARSSSAFGSWLDPVSDRVKEYAVYAGLAIGGMVAHERGTWGLALTAMIVQAIRYVTVLSYRTAGQAAPRPEPGRGVPLPLDEPADYAAPASAAAGGTRAPGGGLTPAARRRFRRAAAMPVRALRWLGRIGYLPAGERSVVIAVTAAVAGPRTAFAVLIAWGAAVTAVTIAVLAARSLGAGRGSRRRPRSQHPPRAPVPSVTMSSDRDDGVIAQSLGRLAAGQLPPLLPAAAGVTVTVALATAGLHYGRIMAIAPVAAMLLAGLGRAHPHDGRLDWLVPPLLRAGEYIYLAAMGIAAAVPRPVIFALIGAVVVHHYDVACRVRLSHGLAPSARAVKAGLGWEGRMLVIAVGAMLGIAPFAYAVLAAYVWILFGWEASTAWLPAPGEHRLAVADVVDLEDGGGW
jgi:phosphatidylglycerophosphate synthase